MDQNPYESPKNVSERPRNGRNFLGLRRKPLWGYAIALVLGVSFGVIVLGPMLASLDDAGGLQILIGGSLGLVIYGLLF